MTADNEQVRYGWGVFRQAPYDFAGLYDSKEEAEAKAREGEGDYLVRYGKLREGAGGFTATDRPGGEADG